MSTSAYPLAVPNGILDPRVVLDASATTFDPAWGVQAWHDPTQAGKTGTVTYNVLANTQFGSSGPVEAPLTIPCSRAAVPNMPTTYPAAPPIAPTLATETFANNMQSVKRPIDPATLSTLVQAENIVSQIQASLGDGGALPFTISVYSLVGWTFNSEGETRQQYQISAPGVPAQFVGNLMELQNANGLGAPGSWGFNATGQIVWNAQPIPVAGPNTPPDVPVPVRPLLVTEIFQAASAVGGWEVVLNPAVNPAAPLTVGAAAPLIANTRWLVQTLGGTPQ